jgi:hypothetical protein
VCTLLVFNFERRTYETDCLFSPGVDVLVERFGESLEVFGVVQFDSDAALETFVEFLKVFAAVIGEIYGSSGLELG